MSFWRAELLKVVSRVKALEALGLDTITPAGLALLDDATASDQLTTLGVSTFIKTLLDDADAATALATLGMTSWVAFTPTFTGLGTCTNIRSQTRRVGDTLEVDLKFTTGTPTAVEARITYGFNGTSGNVTGDATKIPNIRQSGPPAIRTAAGAPMLFPLMENGVSYLTFGLQDAGNAGFTKVNGNAGFGVALSYNVQGSVPISGW